jgi:hypothetical protein
VAESNIGDAALQYLLEAVQPEYLLAWRCVRLRTLSVESVARLRQVFLVECRSLVSLVRDPVHVVMVLFD